MVRRRHHDDRAVRGVVFRFTVDVRYGAPTVLGILMTIMLTVCIGHDEVRADQDGEFSTCFVINRFPYWDCSEFGNRFAYTLRCRPTEMIIIIIIK